jgi:hypothetical protein
MKRFLTLVSIVFMVFSCSSSDDGNNGEDPMSCNAPTGITSASTTTNSSTINWSSNEDSATFEIQYGETGFGLGNGTSINSSNTNTTLNGLSSNTNYQVYVRTNCGENGFSDWTGPSSFTTQEQTCNIPTDLQTFNITDNSATLFWLSSESPISYDVEYGVAGFGLGNGTVITTSNNDFQLTGLLPSTQYEFYVRTNCSSSNSSEYAGPSIFTTEAACSAPFNLDFFNLLACSFDIFWSTNDETAWEVEYGEVGFSLGSGTVISTSNTNIVITDNLSPNTTYEVYVRANCGSEGFSAFTDALVVTTNPVDDMFLVGDYLIQDVLASIGPGNGTENFPNGTVTLNVDPSDSSRRIFFSNVLPAFNSELEEIILQINTDGTISINDVDPSLSCDTINPYIITNAGANNSSIDSCGDNEFIVINYTEDPLASCGGPFDGSFSLTKQ